MVMIKRLIDFLVLLYERRSLIASMARREVAVKYVGSVMGFMWTFIHPLVLILVFWVVFNLGFRLKPIHDAPFVVWLTAGMCGWFVFSDILNGSAAVVVENTNLIKKTLFPSQILPVVKVVSSLVAHSVFIVILIGLLLLNRVPPSWHCLQFLYYLFCLCVLGLGLGWAVSALNVFIRDVTQIVAVVLQVGFWATPILWDIQMMPEKIRFFVKLNPMSYIVQGYRDAFIYHVPFWDRPLESAYFWAANLVIVVGGALIFQKLKPQFPDVL